eukprot:TRINITY_DN10480_c0_g1_i1.p1 TRINITY_DN10480_c0_g1~~TRINITY_DN10480_c0_g1_i1.p1  ORF type:complete len:259 (+),score=61.78 TRINITY_DN10480_c0_g1_i1:135-911(+)
MCIRDRYQRRVRGTGSFSMALRASTRMLAGVNPPALHGSFGQQAVGSYANATGLVGQAFSGFKAHVSEHGLKKTVMELLVHKDVRYYLPTRVQVGSDEFGNRYYEDNGTAENPNMKTRQRSVIFGGENNSSLMDYPFETSEISPAWYAWLHHMDDRIPEPGEKLSPGADKFVQMESGTNVPVCSEPYNHVAKFRPNPTTQIPTMESAGAQYYQPGHLRGGNHRIETYQAWHGETKSTTHVKTHGGIPVANVLGDSSQI